MYLKAEAWKKEVQLDRLVREFHFTERDEVASHGYGHELVTKLSPDAFREDVRTAMIASRSANGRAVSLRTRPDLPPIGQLSPCAKAKVVASGSNS